MKAIFLYFFMYVCVSACMYTCQGRTEDFGIPGALTFSEREAGEISFAAQVNFLAPNSLSHL